MDNTDLIFGAFIVLLLIIGAILFLDFKQDAERCEQYRDYKLSDVPATCINSRGGFKG